MRRACSLADAVGQRGLSAEARALLRAALLPSCPRLLEADALQEGWVPGPLRTAGRSRGCGCTEPTSPPGSALPPNAKTQTEQTSTPVYPKLLSFRGSHRHFPVSSAIPAHTSLAPYPALLP